MYYHDLNKVGKAYTLTKFSSKMERLHKWLCMTESRITIILRVTPIECTVVGNLYALSLTHRMTLQVC